MKHFSVIFTLCLVLAIQGYAQSARDEAISLYKKGDNENAIVSLKKALAENEQDAELQNYLGLAYLKKKDVGKGLSHLEKASKAQPGSTEYKINLAYGYLIRRDFKKARQIADSVIDTGTQNPAALIVRGKARLGENQEELAEKDADAVLAIEPGNTLAHTLKADAIFQRYANNVRITGRWRDVEILRTADEVLKRCLEKCADKSEKEIQESRRELLGVFIEAAAKKDEPDSKTASTDTDGSTKLKILRKPLPRFSAEARENNVTGTIKIFVVFGADGNIAGLIPLNRLGYGLDEKAAEAAMAIQFVPGTRNGKPVASVSLVQYSFATR